MQSTEHRQVGNIASKIAGKSPGVTINADGFVVLVLSGGLPDVQLTYGEIVALGGDFYGVPGSPISSSKQPQSIFLQAHQSLVKADRGELSKIMVIMDEESDAVLNANDPAKAFEALGNTLSYKWNEATGGAPYTEGAAGMATNPGRYTKLANNNLDHFGVDAVAAYRAGHAAACATAASDLSAALAMNAHADHFLSDLFAAGHIRTPRRALDSYGWTGCPPISQASVGSLCSLAMHNEENASGLFVTSPSGQSWKAYGDSWILEAVGSDNFHAAVDALQTSIQEVLASVGGTHGDPAFAALRKIPQVTGTYPPTGGPSIAPMLVNSGSGPAERSGYYEIAGHKFPTAGLGTQSDYWYTTDFTWPTLIGETLGQQYINSIDQGLFAWIGK